MIKILQIKVFDFKKGIVGYNHAFFSFQPVAIILWIQYNNHDRTKMHALAT